MSEKNILIPVRLDIAGFEAFAKFDTFYHRGTMRRMVLFTGILTAFAIACFALGASGREGGVLLGCALLGIGLLLPSLYLLTFFKDVRKKAREMGLEKSTLVYTVNLTERQVEFRPARQGQESRATPWADLYGAWRTKEAIYLYAVPQTAYLLPNGQAKGASDEQLWAFISSHLASQKLHDRTRR